MILNLISGLGANEKVFARLNLQGFDVNHVKWISPKKNESLTHYAARLSKQIVVSENYAIAGLSFGGIMASEITELIQQKPKKTILISSVKTWHELSYIMKKGRQYPLHKLIQKPMLDIGNPLVYWYFGLKTENQKKLLHQFLSESDPDYIKWAINEIVNRQRETPIDNLVQIHGNKDNVFPIKNITPNHTIKGASHFMVYTHAHLVSKILKEELFNLPEN